MKTRRLRILVTAGPTREFIDPVRFISNVSSGRMGYAIAAAAARHGHDVTLVTGPTALRPPAGATVVRVTSASEMYRASRKAFGRCDAAVFVAAVCDYRPARRARYKLSKSGARRSMRLLPNPDIAAATGRIKRGRITIGFALEDRGGRRRAEAKLREKRFDAVVLNSPAGAGRPAARVEWLETGGRWERWPAAAKAVIARRVVSRLERLVERARAATSSRGR